MFLKSLVEWLEKLSEPTDEKASSIRGSPRLILWIRQRNLYAKQDPDMGHEVLPGRRKYIKCRVQFDATEGKPPCISAFTLAQESGETGEPGEQWVSFGGRQG
jgi:hypothetical protein